MTGEGVGIEVRRRFLTVDVPGHVLPLVDLPGQHLLYRCAPPAGGCLAKVEQCMTLELYHRRIGWLHSLGMSSNGMR